MAKHALIAPSACHRIGYCPASVLLSKDIPNESSPYAEEGTDAHKLCEIYLDQLFTGRYIYDTEQALIDAITAKHPDMMAHVNAYVDYAKGFATGALYKSVEVKLPMAPITGEPDSFGTADCLLIAGDTLHVIDFKYGQGVKVEAKENPQLAMYALAALAELDPDGIMYGVANVTLHIFQPRMGNVQSWIVPREKLEGRFAQSIRAAADRALYLVGHPKSLKVGHPFLCSDGKSRGDFATPSDDICRFCLAKSKCPVLHKVTVEALEQDFEDLSEKAEDKPMVKSEAEPKAELAANVVKQHDGIPLPDTPERLARAYEWLPIIRMWADSVESSMIESLKVRGEMLGYKLVAGRPGPRKWEDTAGAEEILRRALKVDEAYERKLISPTTAEKLHKKGTIGPKYWAQLSKLVTRSEGKPQVAPTSDPRPALLPAIEQDFEDLTAIEAEQPTLKL